MEPRAPFLLVCCLGDGYILAKIGDLAIVSVYCSPNTGLEIFLEEVTDHIFQTRFRDLIVAGNFNARSVRWEYRITNKRGKILEA